MCYVFNFLTLSSNVSLLFVSRKDKDKEKKKTIKVYCLRSHVMINYLKSTKRITAIHERTRNRSQNSHMNFEGVLKKKQFHIFVWLDIKVSMQLWTLHTHSTTSPQPLLSCAALLVTFMFWYFYSISLKFIPSILRDF